MAGLPLSPADALVAPVSMRSNEGARTSPLAVDCVMATDPLAVLSTPSGPLPSRRPRPIDVPPPLATLAGRQLGLVSRAQCAAVGMPPGRINRLVARGDWRTVTRGVVLTDLGAVPAGDWAARARQRAVVASLAGGPESLLVGLAALAAHGVEGLPLGFVPEFTTTTGTHVRSRPEVRARRLRRRDDVPDHPKVTYAHGLRTAGPLWALAQALPGLDRDHAVAILDSAVHTGKFRMEDAPLLLALMTDCRGVRSLRSWLPLADGRSESPLETRARLVCQDHGVPPDDLQRVIRDAVGIFVARCDMVWDLGGGRLLIVEMDGGHHRKDGQIDVDNARDNALHRLGHVVYHFTWRDLLNGLVHATVRAELIRAGRLAAAQR